MISHTLIMVAQPGDDIGSCAREAIAICREGRAKNVVFEFNGAAIAVQSGSSVHDAEMQLDNHDRNVRLTEILKVVADD